MNEILYGLLFIMGSFFGSFFTLAVYRIPKKEDILLKRSYCPNCNHRLGFFDLFPIISYLALRGHCRYCGNKIRARYFILEIVSGLSFVCIGWSLQLNIGNWSSILQTIFTLFYISILYILAGIDKEKISIQLSVLLTGYGITFCYIIYQCALSLKNVYLYVMYFLLALLLFLIYKQRLKQKKNEYGMASMLLGLLIIIFTGPKIGILSILMCLIIIAIRQLLNHNLNKNIPIGFYLVFSNSILLLLENVITNYFI